MSNLIKTITNSASLGGSSNLITTAILNIQNTTASTTSNSGSLIVSGGCGVAGDLNIAGVFNSLQSCDTLTSQTYNTNITLSMNTGGMVYYITGGIPAIVTNLSILSLPVTTGLASYVFTLIFVTSSPFYYTFGSNTLSLTLNNGFNTILTPITTGGSVNLPVTYSYILQTITLINQSGGPTPTFIALNSVQAF